MIRVSYRPAKVADARFVYELRNEPSVRAVSGNTSELVWSDHISWFHQWLNRSTYLIIEVDRKRAGYIRVATDHVISFALLPEFRGKRIIPSVLKRLAKTTDKMQAKVRIENASSIKACMRAGMRLRYFIFETPDKGGTSNG